MQTAWFHNSELPIRRSTFDNRHFPVLVACCCCVVTSVCAQAAGPIKAPDGLHADETYTDVYVNDSFEAADANDPLYRALAKKYL